MTLRWNFSNAMLARGKLLLKSPKELKGTENYSPISKEAERATRENIHFGIFQGLVIFKIVGTAPP